MEHRDEHDDPADPEHRLGVLGHHGPGHHDIAADPRKAWPAAFEAIAEATGATPEGVRDFLDSRHGRHFADSVVGELNRGDTLKGAIAAATARWMGWQVGRTTSRETGMPAHLPLLTGLANHFAILAEMAPEEA